MNYRNYPNYQQQPPQQQQIPAQYQQQYQQQPFPPQYPQLPPQRKKKLPQWAYYVLYVLGGIVALRLLGIAVGAHPAEPTPMPNMETLVAQARLFMEATDTVVALSAIPAATATFIPSNTPLPTNTTIPTNTPLPTNTPFSVIPGQVYSDNNNFQPDTGPNVRGTLPGSGTSGSCVIKGNVNSKGERIYHCLNSPSYDKTKVNFSEGDRWFCSPEEAEAAGFRAPENQRGCRY